MSTLITMQIKGIAVPVSVHSEYTNSAVLNAWANQNDGFFSTINRIFGKQKELVRDAEGNIIRVIDSTLSTQDALDMQAAINSILGLAQNGILVGGKTYYLTYEMANSLDKIVKTLDAVGFDRNISPTDVLGVAANVTALKRWVDLDDVGLREIVISAGNAVANSRSLQAMIELEYVKTGNQLIGENLEKLDAALEATKAAIAWLTRAQNLKNKLTPERRASLASRSARLFTDIQHNGTAEEYFRWDPALHLRGDYFYFTHLGGFTFAKDAASGQTVNAATYQDFFKSIMEKTFNTPLSVTPSTTDLAEFSQVRSGLATALAQLTAVGGGQVEDGTVADKIQKLLNEINGAGGNDTDRLRNWIVDHYDVQDVTKSGDYQRTLTDSIVAAESLNDKQKEDLRRFMFIFEEFYKSASAMLQGIDRMITKMATNIKG